MVIHNLAQALRRFPLVAHSVRAARQRRARRIDRRLGIDTVPPDTNSAKAGSGPAGAGSQFNDAVAYDVMDYPLIGRFLKPLHLTQHDVLFDIGCGMGRLLCVAARCRIAGCVGIEIEEWLVAKARANAASLRPPKAPIEIRHGDAVTADYSGGTVYCMFNPFGAATLQAVLKRIEHSLQSNPRTIRIGYNHPAHEQVLAECGWLRCTLVQKSIWYQHRSSFWTNDVAPLRA
jgi:hypothetical protein